MKNMANSMYGIGLFLLLSVSAAFPQAKITIAVLNFEARNVTQETAEAVSDILSTELFKTNRFQVVERRAVQKIFEEYELQISGVTDVNQAARIGQLLNVQTIMIGSVSKLGNMYIINTRLVNVETGELDLAENIRSSGGENLLPKAIADLAEKIAAKIIVQGAVIQVNPGVVMIDLGKDHGIVVNQLLQVVRVGEAITDLDGNVIGEHEEKVGLIKVTDVRARYSSASIVEYSAPIERGDKVLIAVTELPVMPVREQVKKEQAPQQIHRKTDQRKSAPPPPPSF